MGDRISRAALDRVRALAAASPDREVCGLLLADGTIREAANVAPNPMDGFEVDPAVHFAALRHARAGGPGVIGCYHSHPHGPATPSARDAAMALDIGQLWLIVGPDATTLWRVTAPGRFASCPLIVA